MIYVDVLRTVVLAGACIILTARCADHRRRINKLESDKRRLRAALVATTALVGDNRGTVEMEFHGHHVTVRRSEEGWSASTVYLTDVTSKEASRAVCQTILSEIMGAHATVLELTNGQKYASLGGR